MYGHKPANFTSESTSKMSFLAWWNLTQATLKMCLGELRRSNTLGRNEYRREKDGKLWIPAVPGIHRITIRPKVVGSLLRVNHVRTAGGISTWSPEVKCITMSPCSHCLTHSNFSRLTECNLSKHSVCQAITSRTDFSKSGIAHEWYFLYMWKL